MRKTSNLRLMVRWCYCTSIYMRFWLYTQTISFQTINYIKLSSKIDIVVYQRDFYLKSNPKVSIYCFLKTLFHMFTDLLYKMSSEIWYKISFVKNLHVLYITHPFFYYKIISAADPLISIVYCEFLIELLISQLTYAPFWCSYVFGCVVQENVKMFW